MNTTTAGSTMFETQPAVAGLNRVPGFDPRKHMRKTISARTKQEILYLDLKYKKLWFRLAYPKGRIKTTALKITEQIAIIEAKVFLDPRDAEPVSSFIAQRNAGNGQRSSYIEAAQRAAENQALIDAGFGLQFCDVSQGPDAELLDEGVPVHALATAGTVQALAVCVETQENSIAQKAEETTAIMADVRAAQAAASTETQAQADLPETPDAEAESTDAATPEPEAPAETPTETTAEPMPETAAPLTVQSQREDTHQAPAAEIQAVMQTIQPAAAESAETIKAPSSLPALDYTADMPVEDILATMTLAEAVTVVVDTGTCKGMTLADVVEKRPASLKWYLNGYTGKNNVLRAGAKLLLDAYFEQKAS